MFKKNIPWWLKIIIKIFISRLPINYQQWSSMNLFRHGNPDDKLLYAAKFKKHFDLAFPDIKPKGFICLEIGPGDTISTGIVANAFGASKTYLIDVGDFALKDLQYYKDFSNILNENNIKALDISKVDSFEELLNKLNIIYLKNGHLSFKKILDSSVDFIFSHSAIEHVKLLELPIIANETKRVLSSKGRISHNIDLMDHLNYSLNSLRFSQKIWESSFFVNSGFYTNRLRHDQIIKILTSSGLIIIFSDKGSWDTIPIKKDRLHKDFANLEDSELLTRTMHIVLKHNDKLKDS